jgi:hypothetical protein
VKKRNERSPEWAANDEFFSGAALTLYAVKDAWRNPTMHIEAQYKQLQALDVLNSVAAFMRHIAAIVKE